ncbi:hypothetical protein C7M84_002477 [Penaeus vannamei]|uniref:Nbr1 FW domain-containing protein n=1 Tax=Penaeus vannamei TaxID=6689 RepID=A0A423TQR7_PENVA|nr:hypothetical protein C7M84_002477 [Penaeus vannamei]
MQAEATKGGHAAWASPEHDTRPINGPPAAPSRPRSLAAVLMRCHARRREARREDDSRRGRRRRHVCRDTGWGGTLEWVSWSTCLLLRHTCVTPASHLHGDRAALRLTNRPGFQRIWKEKGTTRSQPPAAAAWMWRYFSPDGRPFGGESYLRSPATRSRFLRGADGSSPLRARAAFIKTWRIQNTGEDGWPIGCSLIFTGGEQLGAPSHVSVASLGAGECADVSVEMLSPAEPGLYSSKWRMSTTQGNFFGDTIWVIVPVDSGGTLALMQQMVNFKALGSPPSSTHMVPANTIQLLTNDLATCRVPTPSSHLDGDGDIAMS